MANSTLRRAHIRLPAPARKAPPGAALPRAGAAVLARPTAPARAAGRSAGPLLPPFDPLQRAALLGHNLVDPARRSRLGAAAGGERAIHRSAEVGDLPDLRVGGGYDGETIFVAENADPVAVVTHELGHAVLGHDPSAVRHGAQLDVAGSGPPVHFDPALERDAGAAAAELRQGVGAFEESAIRQVAREAPTGTPAPRRPLLPYLVDGWGSRMSDISIRKLLSMAEYRHGPEEAERLAVQVKHENAQDTPTKLDEFAAKLSSAHFISTKRVGYLLQLLLPRFQDEFSVEREEIGEREAWDAFTAATQFLRGRAPELNQGQAAEEPDETTPLLAQPAAVGLSRGEVRFVRKILPEQWQAAAVAALRAGWLSGVGFLELRRVLREATQGTPRPVELQLSRDVIHDAGLQNEKKDMVNVGTVQVPHYATTEEALNAALGIFESSGYYYEKLGVILKSLDTGHKLVDKWENFSHRSQGKQVDPGVSFDFLALLSPKPGSQEVVGANGQILGDGSYMFTIDPTFRFRYMPAANFVGEGGMAKNFFQFIPHSQLASLGLVVAAGNFVIKEGKIDWIDNGSGHYRVSAGVNEANAKAALHNLGYSTQGLHFLNRAAGDLDQIYSEGNKVLQGLPKGEERPAMTMEILALQQAMDQMR